MHYYILHYIVIFKLLLFYHTYNNNLHKCENDFYYYSYYIICKQSLGYNFLIKRNKLKYLLITILLVSQAFASLEQIELFEADFSQSITDDKDKVLIYNGHVIASKPQNAKWSYKKPVTKDVYINKFEVIIVEPDIEQVIIRKVESKFDFFKMISNAKEIKKDMYVANYKDSKFTIVQSDNLIESISYIDEFENRVKIVFKNQKQNHSINPKRFTPSYPLHYDIIRD